MMLERQDKRRGSRVMLVALGLLGAPCAWAQAEAPEVAASEDESDGGTLGLEFDLAPEMVTHSPFRLLSWTSSATSVAATLRVVEPIGRDWEIAVDAGPSISVVHDRDIDSGSAVGASVEIRARRDFAGLRPFVSYAIERSFRGVFEADGETSHSLLAGLAWHHSRGASEITVELAPRWSFGPDGLDHRAVNLWGEVIQPLIADALNLQLDASIERRWHGDRDAGRRDWRFEAYAGLDAAPVLNRELFGGNVFRSFGAGLRWMRISSNRPDADSSALAFLPAITMRIDFR